MGRKGTSDTYPLPYLRAWRRSQGLSVRELGEKARVSYVTISRLENAPEGRGAASTTVKKLAEALGISRQQLLYTGPQLPSQAEGSGEATKTEDAA